jgi:predicted DNA-binding protein (MmcQ/YjbR family)
LNLEELRDHCLNKPGTTEGLPFGEDTLVFKVGGKMFLLTSISNGDSFNAKCDPERAVELRERYTEVQPGYHMNKKMWNTVYMNGNLPNKLLIELIDHSYDLVFKSLPKKTQDDISAPVKKQDKV